MWRHEAKKRGDNFDKSVERHVSRSTLEPAGREMDNVAVSVFGEGGVVSERKSEARAGQNSQYTDSRGVTTRDARVESHISPKRLKRDWD